MATLVTLMMMMLMMIAAVQKNYGNADKMMNFCVTIGFQLTKCVSKNFTFLSVEQMKKK